jgi:hypothetical protein
VDPAARNCLAFLKAADKGHTEILSFLLFYESVDPAVDHNLAIRCAAQNGHREVVKRLLRDKRVNPGASTEFFFLSRNFLPFFTGQNFRSTFSFFVYSETDFGKTNF